MFRYKFRDLVYDVLILRSWCDYLNTTNTLICLLAIAEKLEQWCFHVLELNLGVLNTLVRGETVEEFGLVGEVGWPDYFEILAQEFPLVQVLLRKVGALEMAEFNEAADVFIFSLRQH